MGYYDFPHTRNYDSDLGFLIKKYKETLHYIESIDSRMDATIQKYIQDNIDKFRLQAMYNENEETIIFKGSEDV